MSVKNNLDVADQLNRYDLEIVYQMKELPETPSEKVKEIVKRFILNMSSDLSPSWAFTSPKKSKEKLIEEDTRMFNKETYEILKSDEELSKKMGFKVIAKGHYHPIWIHKNIPNVVIKTMSFKDAFNQYTVGKKLLEDTKSIKGCLINVPRGQAIEIENEKNGFYIEERLSLKFDNTGHIEFWARIFTHYTSEDCPKTFKINLEKLFDQIYSVIERIGLWDVGLHNFPEISETGEVYAVDFDGVDCENPGKRSFDGIKNMLSIASTPPFVNKIIKTSKDNISNVLRGELKKYDDWVRYLPDLKMPTEETVFKQFNIDIEKNRDQLKSIENALIYYDKNGYIGGNEKIIPPDLSLMSNEEKEIAEYLLNEMNSVLTKNKEYHTEYLTEKRHIHLQPGVEFEIRNVYNRERFENVIDYFTKKGFVIGHFNDRKQLDFNAEQSPYKSKGDLVTVQIYF